MLILSLRSLLFPAGLLPLTLLWPGVCAGPARSRRTAEVYLAVLELWALVYGLLVIFQHLL